MSGPAVLHLEGVRKAFGDVVAVDSVDLDVAEGEVVVVLGRSGSGKSTLIRCVHQLEPIDGGAMYLDGELLGYAPDRYGVLRPLDAKATARQRSRVGMVFQQFNLFAHRTALQNIVDPPVVVRGESRGEVEKRARNLLANMGLEDKADAYPSALSGGQQQRVAIARAMAMEPRLLLFDEPTSALDPELVGEVLGVMQDLARDGMTMVVVTHELEFARHVADRIVFMAEGRIVAQGSVAEMLDHPEDPSLQRFLSLVPGAGAEQGEHQSPHQSTDQTGTHV